jgi:large subunit ribosomal protein L17
MRHRNTGRSLSMDSSERTAMFRNMITSLLLHGKIKTTEPRAKEIRRFAERVISFGKRAPKVEGLEGDALRVAKARRVHAIRLARRWVNNDEALGMLFGEYADRFASRPGGYTRIVKAGRRNGDNAAMAYIALVGAMDEKPAAAPAATEAPTEAPPA